MSASRAARFSSIALAASMGLAAHAAEVTVKNDSLTNFSAAVIVGGFVAGEKAASWLTSPCNGDIRAVQVFWRSPSGTTGETIHSGIQIYRSGTFPTPGALAQSIGGPVLTDGVLNEYRHLDENQVVPVIVPVSANETFVVALEFDTTVTASDPSVVRDVDGNQPGRNALYARLAPGSYAWFNSSSLGVNGDWVIRAVVDCAAGAQADVGVTASTTPGQYTAGQPLAYTIVVANAGPAASPTTTVVDIFPAAYLTPAWTCTPTGGASCAAPSGNGNITQNVGLPAGSSVTFAVTGTVAAGTTGTLVNSATAVVGGGVTDPNPGTNTATTNTGPAAGEVVFANGFEP